jgi:hypothetical protein
MTETLLEITLPERDNFLKIIETLTRIGLETRDKKIVQTCHILHKRGHYYIAHFKELFALDGVSKSDILDEDIQRRNGIAKLLEQWGLCTIARPEEAADSNLRKIKVVPHKEKHLYTLKANYTIGGKK